MSTKRKLQVLATWSALLLLAAAVGCKGFFVNPTLTSLTVGPATPTIAAGNTQQMSVTGTYDDGTTNTITKDVVWQSDDEGAATVSNTGLVMGVAPGTATITAESGTVSGSTTVTVTVANLQSIKVTPANTTIRSGLTQTFTATGTVAGGGTVDLTSSVTWTPSDTNVVTMSGNVATAATVTTSTTITITATSGSISGATNLTVNP